MKKNKLFGRKKKRFKPKKRFEPRKYIKKKIRSVRAFFKALPARIYTSDVENFITFDIIALSLFLMVKKYIGSVGRFLSTVWDFVTAFGHYLAFIVTANNPNIDMPDINVTVTDIPNIDLQKYLPFSLEDLERKIRLFGDTFFDYRIFFDYNELIFRYTRKFALSAPLLLIAILLLGYVYIDSLLKTNDKPAGSFSRPYEVFLKVLKFLKAPLDKVVNYVKYVWEQTRIRKLVMWIWLINLNTVSIALSVGAWYFYFISSFDVQSIFIEVIRLLYDVVIMLSGLPFFIWLIIAFVIYIAWAFNEGYKELSHLEAKNCGFLKSLAYIINITGDPGVGKTSNSVHMALEWNNIQHCDALDKMFKMEMLFPAFSFAAFRKELKEAIKLHEIYCPPCCDYFVDRIEEVWNRTPSPAILYGYDTDLFAYDKDTGTALMSIFDAMRIYARAYYIYSNDNLIVSALPIRLDGYFKFLGHLEKWYGEFFRRSMREVRKIKKYSHILDEDVWRLGKHMDENNELIGTFGPGIWVKPEIGKSHGNQNETEGQRKDDEECNEKNDMFHWMLKMIRHVCSTVDNTVFMRVITDEQRPEDLPANVRMVLTVMRIPERSELKLALPFPEALDWTYDKIYVPFKKFYWDYCYNRSDMVLSMMLMKFACSALSNLYEYLYNTFGYFEELIETEKGSTYGKSDSAVKQHIYYYFVKLGYSERFSTDSHSLFFAKEQLAAKLGIRDYPEYQDIKMSPEEMDKQHDFFIEKMKLANRSADLQDERDQEYKEKKFSYKTKKTKKSTSSHDDVSLDLKVRKF